MPGPRKQLTRRRVAHKSTGGMPPAIPAPVDPLGNAPGLTPNTVASTLRRGSGQARLAMLAGSA